MRAPFRRTLSKNGRSALNDREGEAGSEDFAIGVAMPAAGLGVRMGGVKKPFLELQGEPILRHSLRPFLDYPQVESIAVALSEEDFFDPPGWLSTLDPRVVIVKGGPSRGDSVWAAIQALSESVEIVAVHDAARPLVTGEIIHRCIQEAKGGRGAVAGWPAVDTLKHVDEGGRIRGTLLRQEVWHAQTPQVFPREMITRAYRQAFELGISETDDSALVERAGGEVVMVRGSFSNLKVTRHQDLPLAELFLRGEAG